MPEPIRKIFIANNYIVNYRITPNGYFEARIRRKNFYVEASARDFETMRRRFMERLTACFTLSKQESAPTHKRSQPEPKHLLPLFTDFAEQWLKVKESTTKPLTFKEYKRQYEADLKPLLQGKRLNEIKRDFLQNYLLAIVNDGKERKAEKLALMLRCIFDIAAEDYNIPSPMKKVVLPKHFSKKGKAFTKDEEMQLVQYCKTHQNQETVDALLVLLYFGLRRSELKTMQVLDDTWLEVETSKQRMGLGVVKRKIPYTPMVRKVLPYINFDKAKHTNVNSINTTLKRLFPNHHTHELRYTFITRCKECLVQPELVMLWDGHSDESGVIASKVDRGYTDFSDEFQLKEAQKVDY